MARARDPVSAAALAAISPAALLVNVMARISPGATPALGQQVGDPVRQHPGLARARAGHDEQRAALVHDGSALLRVQPVQEGIGSRRGSHVHSVGAATDDGHETA